MKQPELSERLEMLESAGKEFREMEKGENHAYWEPVLQVTSQKNGWFQPEQVKNAFAEWGKALTPDNIACWASAYDLTGKGMRRVGIVMAGNIPMAGLHDLLSVILTGNRATAKLSALDDQLIPALFNKLSADFPWLMETAEFTTGPLKGADFYIATGSGNSSRYFREFFGKYEHIIRSHRNSAAVITGRESHEEIELLGKDIFTYYGLGCRSISKLFVPEGYDPDHFFKGIYDFSWVLENKKYTSNFDYYRAIWMLNKEEILENGFLLYNKREGYASPPASVYWENYQDIAEAERIIEGDKAQLQCVVSSGGAIRGTIPFGTSQSPALWDYADDIDTVGRLLGQA